MAKPPRRRRWTLPLVVAAGLIVASLGVTRAAPAIAVQASWDGGIDLYRSGTYSVQKSWLWCTAAGVQIVRNIVELEADHSASAQRRYFAWMRLHNHYHLPLSAGVDPAGWTAGLRHFVDDRYRLVASKSFDGALRSAVRRLRETNLPVALTVSHGNHGWILTGFTATADPLTTASFKVTTVRVVGPLYSLQSRNGYDMPPDTKLTPTQLRRYFTPWHYAPMSMVWDGRWVSIQPVPVESVAATVRPSPPAVGASGNPGMVAVPIGLAPAAGAGRASAVPGATPSPQAVSSWSGLEASAWVSAGLVVFGLLVLIAVIGLHRRGPSGRPDNRSASLRSRGAVRPR